MFFALAIPAAVLLGGSLALPALASWGLARAVRPRDGGPAPRRRR
jgi:hypothetical protein